MIEIQFTIEEILRATRGTHSPKKGQRRRSIKQDGDTNSIDDQFDKPEYCRSISTDSRRISNGSLFVALKGPNYDAHSFLGQALEQGAFGAIVSRGAKEIQDVAGHFHIFEVEDTLVALGRLAKHHRERFPNVKIAGITGSNGKTTTKELLSAALAPLGDGFETQGNLNNRIGVPLTLFRLGKNHRWAVVEMGMNEAGEISRLTGMTRPSLGLVTTASEVHLAGLGSVDGVAAAKSELYRGLRDGSIAVVNLDDPRLPLLAEAEGAIEAGGRLRRVTYGVHPRADVRLGDVEVTGDGLLSFQVLISPKLLEGFRKSKIRAMASASGHLILDISLPLLGRHNAHNACGALAAALAFGVAPEEAARSVAKVRLLPRRLEKKIGPRGSLILDDCYNASPSSVRAALETASEIARVRQGRVLAVLGDMLELGEEEEELHRGIGRAAASLGVHAIFALGEKSKVMVEAAEAVGLSEVAWFRDHAQVVERIGTLARPADVILVKGSRGMALEKVADPLVDASMEAVK